MKIWIHCKKYFIAIPPPFLSTKKQIRQEWQLDKCFKGETIYFVSVANISVQVLQTFYLNCVTPVASRASGGHGRKHRNLPIFASARFSSWQYFLWADFHTSTICFGPIFLRTIFSWADFPTSVICFGPIFLQAIFFLTLLVLLAFGRPSKWQ